MSKNREIKRYVDWWTIVGIIVIGLLLTAMIAPISTIDYYCYYPQSEIDTYYKYLYSEKVPIIEYYSLTFSMGRGKIILGSCEATEMSNMMNNQHGISISLYALQFRKSSSNLK